jgi:3-oxoacyl-[acyl-carrier-protein] synthase-3
MNEVYITKAAKFLPNEPVLNENMEEYLGLINNKTSKSKPIVLRNNGIKSRYYAMKKGGIPTHTNSEMVSLAIRNMFDNDPKQINKIDLLSCGTSSPDQMMPSHGVMVHGWLPETNAIEVISPSGVCCSGMHALKYAWMAVKLGEAQHAVASGSERFSPLIRSDAFEEEASKISEAEENPYISFEKDFLRWMLSDGAGTVLLSNKKNTDGISLRIDYLGAVSYAHQAEPCMYMGSEKINGKLKSFMDYSQQELIEHSVLSIKQDIKLLSENIVELGYIKLRSMLEENNLKTDAIDYFLPHISSEFFRNKIAEKLDANNMHIPPEKWFVNLSKIGNVGAGSIYITIEELFNNGKLKAGEKIVLLVPESGRFSYVYAILTVCE